MGEPGRQCHWRDGDFLCLPSSFLRIPRTTGIDPQHPVPPYSVTIRVLLDAWPFGLKRISRMDVTLDEIRKSLNENSVVRETELAV